MTAGKSNLAASVAARLLNHAKLTGDVYQNLLTSFCFERFLYRLGRSDVRERFVLKGAMLLRLWSDQPYRATRDLDLLRQGDGSSEAIRTDIRTICWENSARPAQVRAFARRAGIAVGADPAPDLARLLVAFLLPVLEDVQRGTPREGAWPPGGPWR